MTNEEAKAFLDNLKILVSEHPVVADWLVEIADRKTEPTISKMEQVDWKDQMWAEAVEDEPQTDEEYINNLPWVEVGNGEQTDEPQTDCETCRHYKLACDLFSEVCKYEPITQAETQNSNLTFEKQTDCAWR